MYIKDIFYSFQGEGPWVGYPQVFIRFYGCNIHCAYCDEPDYVQDRVSYTTERVLQELAPFMDKPIHSISITGGEPMIQLEALKALIPALPFPVYLETNGTLPKGLPEIKNLISYFSVDFKPGFKTEFSEFIKEIKDHPNLYVKFVLTRDFAVQDIEWIGKVISEYNKKIPFVIQPVTPYGVVTQKASPEDILRAYQTARYYIEDVRIIPQTHKFIGIK